MEKITNDLNNFSNLPPEIQQHIATYLEAPALGFFAQSNKCALKYVLPLLIKYQARFSLQLASKGNNTFFYQADHLFGCGNNEEGQLGLGDTANCSVFTAVPWFKERGSIRQIIAGSHHTVVLSQDNKLWVCGNNEYGQLGLGDEVNRTAFTAVPWPEGRGRIEQVIASGCHTVVLTKDKQLWVCGYNDSGQLGLGDEVNRTAFTAVPWPKGRGKIKQVTAGGHFTMVLTQDNQVWVCGYNGNAQLGLGSDYKHCSTFTPLPWPKKQGTIEQVIAGRYHTVVLTQDNQLWMCGDNMWSQLGLGDNVKRWNFTVVPWPADRGKIEQVIAGCDHTVVLTEDNHLWVCGGKNWSQMWRELGYTTFTIVPWPKERGRIKQVIAGINHIIVLTDANTLWVYGNDCDGQLGLGLSDDGHHVDTFTRVNNLPEAMQPILMLNNTLDRLIKMGRLLTQTLDTKKMKIFHTQHQVDEPEGQPPLKKIKL